MTLHVMVDIETLGLEPRAIVLEAGFFLFRVVDDQVVEESALGMTLSLPEQFRLERTVDPATVDWWVSNRDRRNLIADLVGQAMLSTNSAVDMFNQLWSHIHQAKKLHESVLLWALGSMDFAVLGDLQKQVGFGSDPVWAYYQEMNLRSIFNILPNYDYREHRRKLLRESDLQSLQHRAIIDCQIQAKMLAHCLNELGISQQSGN